MGAVASTAHGAAPASTSWLAVHSGDPSASTLRQLFAVIQRYGGASVHMWIRFWIYITGLEKHEQLIHRMIAQIKYRKYALPSQRHSVFHSVFITLVELWLRTIRVVLVPDVIARYLCATFVLHIVYEFNAGVRGVITRACMRLTAHGRRTLRLKRQLERARTFQERQAIAGELDKIEGKDKWREDPASGLFLYERVMNKTQMYKVRVRVLWRSAIVTMSRLTLWLSVTLVSSACNSRTTSWGRCLRSEQVCSGSTGASATRGFTQSATVRPLSRSLPSVSLSVSDKMS